VASGYVTAFGEGLNFGSCGKAATFEVVGGGSKFNTVFTLQLHT
jgi:hypothetical protein